MSYRDKLKRKQYLREYMKQYMKDYRKKERELIRLGREVQKKRKRKRQ